ncbi:hypothetical protein [Mycolicibacterium fallax]|nr:hypothetical protein [Mycolicibacterium fallax]HOW93270.1 hypothetical protein [Mycolicibacterium fallax]HSA39574.1 hypothetical protein [Mycobacterium sp.]
MADLLDAQSPNPAPEGVADDTAAAQPTPAQPAATPPSATGSTSAPKWAAIRARTPGIGRAMARQAAAASSKFAPLANRAGDAVIAASPLTLGLAALSFLLTASIIASVALDNTLGVTAAILFVPALAGALGAAGMRSIDDRRRSRAAREVAQRDALAAQSLERTLDYVDAKLTRALDRFGTERHSDAVVAMFQAKAATELCLGPVPPGPSRDPQATEVDVDRYGLAGFFTSSALTSGDSAGLRL